jgi:hypothetical protein
MIAFDRRELLRRLSLAGIGALTSPAWARALGSEKAHAHAAAVQAAAAPGWTPTFLTADQDKLVTAVAEAIIPKTDTPGATAAFVNRYVDAILADAEEDEQDEFVRGLAWMDRRSQSLFGKDFVAATPEQQNELLTVVAAEDDHSDADDVGRAFFDDMKAKTIVGYYTSEVGINEELKDGGPLFFMAYAGCAHPEHGAAAPSPAAPSVKKG